MTRKPTCVACKGAGGGADYTAGTGIVIESNEISADTSVLATKSELPPTLTALSPININTDNQINLKDYAQIQDVANLDFTTMFDKNGYYLTAKKDMVISFGSAPLLVLMKGTIIYQYFKWIDGIHNDWSYDLSNLANNTTDNIPCNATINKLTNKTTYYELLINSQSSSNIRNKRTDFIYWVRE